MVKKPKPHKSGARARCRSHRTTQECPKLRSPTWRQSELVQPQDGRADDVLVLTSDGRKALLLEPVLVNTPPHFAEKDEATEGMARGRDTIVAKRRLQKRVSRFLQRRSQENKTHPFLPDGPEGLSSDTGKRKHIPFIWIDRKRSPLIAKS